MASHANLRPRQIWANPTPTTTALPRHCTPFPLPSGGLVAIGVGNTITLTEEAIFQPYCTERPNFNTTDIPIEEKDPFYASTIPLLYAIAAVTVVSYLLVIILFITPRTFFVGGSAGGGGFLGQRGMISGASGSSSVIGVGGRPWLQKVAALSVAISLTIASVDTFRVAQYQYNRDYSDAQTLTQEVVSSVELRIVRVVSETFLWLAQAQTLIRLFPRHKEKVIIKWAGFVLIGLDTIFSILNNFVSGTTRSAPRKFQDAVPALSYLFTFCLSLIYAAWIIYYSLSKRRYAFIHAKMRNICLVALLSLVAVLIPVVFFVLDISIYDVAGWGNYVRWVGAAAASVVVWEWVERIEALERDERKDGILGREIFDGDEMLEVTPSSAMTWSGSGGFGGGRGSGGKDDSPSNAHFRSVASMARRLNQRRQTSKARSSRTSRPGSLHLVNENRMTEGRGNVSEQAYNPTAADGSSSTWPGNPISPVDLPTDVEPSVRPQQLSNSTSSGVLDKLDILEPERKDQGPKFSMTKTFWDTVQKFPIPFLNRHMSPPIEVKQAVRSSQQPGQTQAEQTPPEPGTTSNAYGLFDRIGFKKPPPAPKVPLPITIVPAPPRNRASWNDARFHTDDSSPPFRPDSQHASSQVASSEVPLDQLSRRSTPVAISSATQRYSPAPSQAYRLSRGMTPVIAENTTHEQPTVGEDAFRENSDDGPRSGTSMNADPEQDPPPRDENHTRQEVVSSSQFEAPSRRISPPP
ncbi:MAG: hypothetical protein L6R40_006528 [Gallowayella cf. fulva]|nr:MAG: hypothetical protein L6R40_006528 [Xanthomendoza cf. fulva]